MSSQVNKSNVRFRPKVKTGPRTRNDSGARRGSVTINTNFSAPIDKDAAKARVDESAIAEDDEPMPPPAAIPLAKRRNSSLAHPFFAVSARRAARALEEDSAESESYPQVATIVPGAKSVAETSTETVAPVAQAVEPTSEPKSEPKSDPKAEPKAEQSSELKPELQVESKLESKPAQVSEPVDVAAPLSPKSSMGEPHSIPQPVQPVHPAPVGPAKAQDELVDSKIQLQTATPMSTQAETQMDTKMDTQMDTQEAPVLMSMDPRIKLQMPDTPMATQDELMVPPHAPVNPLTQANLAFKAETPNRSALVPAKPAEDARTASDDELDEVFREPRYDEDGKEIIEPEDLKRFGKYNAKVHFYNKAINADTFTMAQLCSDIPVGEHDKKYYDYEALRSSRKRERALLLKAKQMIRGQHTPKSEQKRMELLRVYKDWQDRREEMFGSRNNGLDIDSIEAPAQLGAVAPKLVTDADGNIVIDSQSLQVDRHANNKADEENNSLERIEAKNFGYHVNSYSFSNKERPERWTTIETETFYNAVSVWGTDFNLIAQFFPQRNRSQIKTKFKYEERRNPEKLRLYMIHRKKVCLEDIARISGREIVPVADIESDLELVRREHAEQLVKEQEARESAIREDAQRKSMDHMRRRKARGISGTSEVVGEITKKEEEEW